MEFYKPEYLPLSEAQVKIVDGLELVQVLVKGEEYAICEESSRNRWSNTKTGHYGKGMINTESDAHRVERTGMLGEMALAKLFNLDVDIRYIHMGDKYDFIIGGSATLDVKTATKNIGSGLIYARKNRLAPVMELTKDIYVFAFIEYDDLSSKEAMINIVGYIKGKDISDDLYQGRAQGSEHYNYEVSYFKLKPLEKLLAVHKKHIDDITRN